MHARREAEVKALLGAPDELVDAATIALGHLTAQPNRLARAPEGQIVAIDLLDGLPFTGGALSSSTVSRPPPRPQSAPPFPEVAVISAQGRGRSPPVEDRPAFSARVAVISTSGCGRSPPPLASRVRRGPCSARGQPGTYTRWSGSCVRSE